ncbi:MAG: hypothetical protein WAL35_08730, partial [Acidimicrobiales bacterium]
ATAWLPTTSSQRSVASSLSLSSIIPVARRLVVLVERAERDLFLVEQRGEDVRPRRCSRSAP